MSELQTLFDNGHQHYLPHLSVDCVIFGFHDNELKVLLLESWYTKDKVLPGGFVGQQESLIDAATRVLKESASATRCCEYLCLVAGERFANYVH
mgnify:CR=1 FL=1